MDTQLPPTKPDPSDPTAAQAGCYDLTGAYGLIRVSGEDAPGLLQGQATCDVKALAPGCGAHGALCTPKGRVIANFRLLRGAQGYFLLLAADLAALVRKRLQMYVLRSKVTLEDMSPGLSFIGGSGDIDPPTLGHLGIASPEPLAALREGPHGLGFRFDEGRWLVAAQGEQAGRIAASLGGATLAPERWRLGTIEAGIPEITAAVTEEFLPQMLNLDALGGISYQKGCYTGQEIVARTHFLGQIKRRMIRLRCAAESEPAPGTPLYDANDPGLNQAGQVVMAAPDAPGSYQLLAVVGLERMGCDLRLLRPDGSRAEALTLPYTWE